MYSQALFRRDRDVFVPTFCKISPKNAHINGNSIVNKMRFSGGAFTFCKIHFPLGMRVRGGAHVNNMLTKHKSYPLCGLSKVRESSIARDFLSHSLRDLLLPSFGPNYTIYPLSFQFKSGRNRVFRKKPGFGCH